MIADASPLLAQEYGYLSVGKSRTTYQFDDLVSFALSYSDGGAAILRGFPDAANGSTVEMGYQYDAGAGLTFGWSSGISVTKPAPISLRNGTQTLDLGVRYRDLYSTSYFAFNAGSMLIGPVFGLSRQRVEIDAFEQGAPVSLTGSYRGWMERLEYGIQSSSSLGPLYVNARAMRDWSIIRRGRLFGSDIQASDGLTGQYFPRDYNTFLSNQRPRRNAARTGHRGWRYSFVVGLSF